jgi:hypothetical protein
MYTAAWWLDYNQTQRITMFPTAAGGLALLQTMAPASTCFSPFYWEGNPGLPVVPTLRQNEYRDVDTVMLAVFGDGAAHSEVFVIPAPDVTLTTTNGYDASGGLMANFIISVINHGMQRAAGTLISTLLAGNIVKKWRGNLAGLPSLGHTPLHFRTTVWVDGKGLSLVTHYPQSDDDLDIVTQAQQLSSAGYTITFAGTFLQSGNRAPTPGPYAGIRDEARLRFSDNSGTISSLVIPGPQPAMFLPDQYHVDPAYVAPIVAQALADLQTRRGTPVAKYLGGVRTRRIRWSA